MTDQLARCLKEQEFQKANSLISSLRYHESSMEAILKKEE